MPSVSRLGPERVNRGWPQGGRRGFCSRQARSEHKVLRPPLSAASVGARLLALGSMMAISGMTLVASLGRRRIISFECHLFT